MRNVYPPWKNRTLFLSLIQHRLFWKKSLHKNLHILTRIAQYILYMLKSTCTAVCMPVPAVMAYNIWVCSYYAARLQWACHVDYNHCPVSCMDANSVLDMLLSFFMHVCACAANASLVSWIMESENSNSLTTLHIQYRISTKLLYIYIYWPCALLCVLFCRRPFLSCWLCLANDVVQYFNT